MQKGLKLQADLFIEGKPRGKGRPRFNTVTGRAYTDKATRDYESYIAQKYVAELRKNGKPIAPLKGAVSITIGIWLDLPTMIDGRHLRKAEREELELKWAQFSKPDIDNVSKVVLDALNGIAYEDDKQVIGLFVSKRYVSSEMEGIDIRIYGE